MTHQRADAIDADRCRQIASPVSRDRPARRRPVPACRREWRCAGPAYRPRLQAVERRDHAGRIAVEAVVDHGDAAGGLLDPAAGHDADLVEFVCASARRIEAGGMDRRQRRQRVLQAMRRAGRQAEVRSACRRLRAVHVPALAMRGVLQLAHLGCAAEADDPCRSIPARSTSAGNTSTPCLRQALRDARPSRAGSLPGCRAFPDAPAAHSPPAPPSAASISLSRAISPVWFMPISTTHSVALGLALHSVSGTPQKLLKTARAGKGACG